MVKPGIVIACGGLGKRMGGSKPLRMLGGATLLRHACDWATARSDHVALAVREAGQLFDESLPLLIDRHTGIGPISALASAFDFAQATKREHVLVIGCDQPFLPNNLVARLSAAIGDGGAAMPTSLGREQPLATLWRADRGALAEYLAKGGQSLKGFAHRVNAVTVEWETEPACDPFFNVNDPVALEEAERRFRRTRR